LSINSSRVLAPTQPSRSRHCERRGAKFTFSHSLGRFRYFEAIKQLLQFDSYAHRSY
jgi:hypothetical protein